MITTRKSMALALLLLLFVQVPAFSGQSVITVVEQGVGGVPSWVDVCLSNGYHKVTEEGLTGTLLAKSSSTKAFLVIGSTRRDPATIELEIVDAISGIVVYLYRYDPSALDARVMNAILHDVEGTSGAIGGGGGAVTVKMQYAGRTKEQERLHFALKQALVRSRHILVRGDTELQSHAVAMQNMVIGNNLSVGFPVNGRMFPAQYCLKPDPKQGESLSFYVTDSMSGQVTDHITIRSQKDIPAGIKKITALGQRTAKGVER